MPISTILNKIKNDSVKLRLTTLISDKDKANRIIRKINVENTYKIKEDRRQELYKLLRPGGEKKFFGKLKAWRKVPSEFPSELILNGKTYRGEEEVLEGFA